MTINLDELTVDELISLYAKIPKLLKEKGVIRTNNFLGDLGEYLVIQHYNHTSGLPNLQAAPPGTKNVDALSRNGDRYSIKATRSNGTGVFYGLNDPDSTEIDKQKFEYVIIIQFDVDYQIINILELNWDLFLKHKRWHSRARAWTLGINQNLIADSKRILDNTTN